MQRSTLAGLGLVVLGAGGVVAWQLGAGPLPDPEGCTARVAGHTVDLDPEQSENASLITAIAVSRGMPARAASIALATAYQESKIKNITYGDRDSQGLFQQRPSQGWGTVEQITDPVYATNAFYDALEKIDGYESMRITEAAQAVQRSGFPEAYEDHAEDARALASALAGHSGDGQFSCVVQEVDGGDPATVKADVRAALGADVRRDGRSLISDERDWALAYYLVAQSSRLGVERVRVGGLEWQVGRDSEDGWTDSGDDVDGVVATIAR